MFHMENPIKGCWGPIPLEKGVSLFFAGGSFSSGTIWPFTKCNRKFPPSFQPLIIRIMNFLVNFTMFSPEVLPVKSISLSLRGHLHRVIPWILEHSRPLKAGHGGKSLKSWSGGFDEMVGALGVFQTEILEEFSIIESLLTCRKGLRFKLLS